MNFHYSESEKKVIVGLEQLKHTEPDLKFLGRFRHELMVKLELEAVSVGWLTNLLMPVRNTLALAMLLFAVIGTASGAAFAAQNSLPNDFLYPVKLATEQAKIVLASNEAEKASLRAAFAEKRLAELEEAAARDSSLQDSALVIQSLDRFESELVLVHDQIAKIKNSGTVDTEASALISMQDKTDQISQKLNELNAHLAEPAKSSEEVRQAFQKAEEAIAIGADRIADSMFGLALDQNLSSTTKAALYQKVVDSPYIQSKLENLNSRLSYLEGVVAARVAAEPNLTPSVVIVSPVQEEVDSSTPPFIAPESDPSPSPVASVVPGVSSRAENPFAGKLSEARVLLDETKMSAGERSEDNIVGILQSLVQLENSIEDLEVALEE